MTCPKCGFEQSGGEECRSCGLIFSKYRPHPSAQDTNSGGTVSADSGSAKGWRYYFRVFRWVSLSFTVLVLGLILWPASPPEVQVDAGSVVRASTKMRDFGAALQSGRGGTLELSESELNAWLQTNLDLPSSRKRSVATEKVPDSAVPQAERPVEPPGEPGLEEVQSSISDVRVILLGDRVKTYVSFSLYGKQMSFQLEGRLKVENGYLRLQPTAGKMGSLPIPGITLGKVVDQLFNSAENREKFRLPAEIEDIRIVDSRLRVVLKGTR